MFLKSYNFIELSNLSLLDNKEIFVVSVSNNREVSLLLIYDYVEDLKYFLHLPSHFEFKCDFNLEYVKTNLKPKTVFASSKVDLIFILDFNIVNVIDINLINWLEGTPLVYLKDYKDESFSRLCHFYKNDFSLISAINFKLSFYKFIEYFNNNLKIYLNYYLENVKYFESYNKIFFEVFTKLNFSKVGIDLETALKEFNITSLKKDYVLNNYNYFTLTGRPSNATKYFNFMSLKKGEGGIRKIIKSKFKDGSLLEIDFNACQLRLFLLLINKPFLDEEDIYEVLLHKYKHHSFFDRQGIKKFIFYEMFSNDSSIYTGSIKEVQYFEEYKNKLYNFFTEKKYIVTPIFKRKMLNLPTTIKKGVLFSYFMQSFETEFNVVLMDIIFKVLKNNFKSQLILYNYDSFVFDIHPDDEFFKLFKVLKKVIQKKGMFVKFKRGLSYDRLSLV